MKVKLNGLQIVGILKIIVACLALVGLWYILKGSQGGSSFFAQNPDITMSEIDYEKSKAWLGDLVKGVTIFAVCFGIMATNFFVTGVEALLVKNK